MLPFIPPLGWLYTICEVLAERDGSFALHGVVVYVVVVEHLLDGPSSCGHDVYVGYAGLP